jgi:SPP1 family phage portal protein
MNEEDRFAWAYLLLSDGLAEKDAQKIKDRRMFTNLSEKGFVKFLTKDIPTNFFQFMEEWIRKEIHRQTHIPDFLDMSAGPLTGAALDRLLYDFEFLCATKETFFKDGLYDRILMLDSLKNITDSEFVSEDIEIVMQRNRPADNLSNAQIATAYKMSGLPITDKTLVENFAPFVKNVDEEIAFYEEQQQAQMEMFGNDEMFETGSTEESTDTEENKDEE